MDTSPAPAHAATVAHHGSFAHATCPACGWVGAGRRAVARAHEDAEVHRLLGGASAAAGMAEPAVRVLPLETTPA